MKNADNSSENKEYSHLLGAILILVSSIGFSAKAIFAKLIYKDVADPVTVLFLRMVFSLPFFLIGSFISSRNKEKKNLNLKEWSYLAFLGFIGYYLSSIFDFIGLVHVSAGMERLILFIYPTIVVLVSAFHYKRSVKKKEIVSLSLTYLGILIVFSAENFKITDFKSFYYGSFLIFLCAFTYALYLIGSESVIPSIGASRFTSYAMTFACLSIIIHYFLTHPFQALALPANVYYLSFSMAIISTVIPTFTLSQGIKRIGSGNASIIGTFGPVSTIFLAYIFLDERFTAIQIAGTALVIAGVLIVSYAKTKN